MRSRRFVIAITQQQLRHHPNPQFAFIFNRSLEKLTCYHSRAHVITITVGEARSSLG